MSLFRTFITYAHLSLTRKKQMTIDDGVKHVVYTDNRFERHFDQVSSFFDSGFIPAEKSVLLCKFHFKSFAYTRAAARARGIKTVFFLTNAQIPALNGKHVFYPYNAQSNCRLILNRKAPTFS